MLNKMNSTEEDYLQKITELVYDDNAIVTCTSLSKILKIKIDDAQRLLDTYVENADMPNQNDISCTYIVIGVNSDSGILVLVVKEKELDEKKHTLKSIVSQHVYSVQKNKDIDLTVLANVEPLTGNYSHIEPLSGAVICENAIKRKLKVKPNIAKDVKPENKTETKQTEIFVIKTKVKKGGIENFCLQGNIQTNSVKPKIETKSKKKNMMANFFSKSTTKVENLKEQSKSESSKDVTEGSDINEEDINTLMEEPMETEVLVPHEKENVVHNKDLKKNNSPKQSKKSIKRQSKSKSNQPSKKRKRIVETNSSDSDIFASSESEVEVTPDINFSEEETEGQKKVESKLPARTRRMKQITEEFMDEDGYMNTITKCIMISDDDEEEKEQNPISNIIEKPIMKNQELTSKNEISSKKSNKNNKGKSIKPIQNQTSIMNFFKKT